MASLWAGKWRNALAWLAKAKVYLGDAGPRFRSLSLTAKAAVVSLGAAFLAGLFGAVGEDAWKWLITPSVQVTPNISQPMSSATRALSDSEKIASFEKQYPGVRLELGAVGMEDGSFSGFKRNLKMLPGNWQVGPGIFVGRKFVPARIKISTQNLLSAHLSMGGCEAEYRIFKAKDGDSVTLRTVSATGGWCRKTAGLIFDSITDENLSTSFYMQDGSINGPNILVKSFEGL
jgi:hypothetical protein